MSNLIVRVKRRRDQEAPDSLCVVEDNEPKAKISANDLTKRLQTLNYSETSSDNQSTVHLLLQRIDTIHTWQPSDIDSKTLACSQSVNSSKRKSDSLEMGTSDEGSSQQKSKSLLLTSGKRAIRGGDSKSFVVVDMSFAPAPRHPTQQSASDQLKTSPSKIENPATRKMEAAIAIANNNSDFSQVLFSLQQGGNVNYQAKTANLNGVSALMCAVKHCNLRMVKKLLSLDANVALVDTNGLSAMDYAQRLQVANNRMEQKIEIQQWLYRTAVRQQQQQQMKLPPQHHEHDGSDSNSSSSSAMIDGGDVAESEYVYDIYCYRKEMDASTGASLSSDPSESVNSTVNNVNYQGQLVAIDGIHIKKNSDGEDVCYNVELLFDYNSDWSDLADDESVDSNDERFIGNDYPDDDDDDENHGGAPFIDEDEDDNNDSDDDNNQMGNHGGGGRMKMSTYNSNRMNNTSSNKNRMMQGENSDYDFSDDEDDDVDVLRYKKPAVTAIKSKVQIKGASRSRNPAVAPVLSASKNKGKSLRWKDHQEGQDMLDDGGSEDGFDANVSSLPRFQNTGVGRVLHHGVLGNGDDGIQVKDKQYIQEIWGETTYASNHDGGDGNDDNDEAIARQERLVDMHGTSGFDFASNPREFDENGLPKYGVELSDDEALDVKDNGVLGDLLMSPSERQHHFGHLGDGPVRRINNFTQNYYNKPSRDTVAYDSDLDKSD